jgi:hypothetical protein
MGNIFNPDFRDFLQALNSNDVEYLLVGGYAVILHGYSRVTADMDIWVNRTSANYKQLVRAFIQFGMPVFDMSEEKFLAHNDWDVFRFGRKPVAIDIMTKMADSNFEECVKHAKIFEDDDLVIKVVHYNDLIHAKKAAGRGKDLTDLENLPPEA